MTDSISELINDKGVCKTAPTTPGLLIGEILTTPNICAKMNALVIALIVLFILDVKIAWFGCHMVV